MLEELMNTKFELDKNLINAYYYHRNDMFGEALECYMAAAELDDKNEDIWFEMGSCLYSLGNYPKSLECSINALKINSSHKKVWFNSALALSMMNENNRALEFYTEAIKIDPSYSMAYFARANTFYQLGKWAHAVEDYTITLSLSGDFSSEEEDCHFYRGVCYEKLGSWDFARIDYNWVLSRSPRRYDAIRHRAMLSFREKKYYAALGDIKRAREIYPKSERLSQIQRKIETQIEMAAMESTAECQA
jgi:tetratricopeptide (TPR) repeat protein